MTISELIPNVDIPEGTSGDWKIGKFTVEQNLSVFQSIIQGRAVAPGTYTRLLHKNHTIMSDTPAEKKDHIHAVFNAKGHILINGLGIGMVLNACLLKPEVEHATVIENSKEVIHLVADHYNRKFPGRVEIIHADAFEYTPPKNKKFDMVWHDIWTDICPDNLPEMTRLHRKYAKRTTWQNSWSKELCQQ